MGRIIVLLGGGPSALVAGIIAQSFGKPLIAISTFGGNADTVWTLLRGGQLATETETKNMGLPSWAKDSAAILVRGLGAQRERLRAEAERRHLAKQAKTQILQNQAWLTVVLVLGAVFLTALGTFWTPPNSLIFGLIFLGTPLLAGSSGGLARNLLDAYRPHNYGAPRGIMLSTVLGMLAGLIAALLFVVAQWATNPSIRDLGETIPPGINLLVPFELIIAFIAGLTLETVFSKLQQTDVVNVEPVAGG